MRSHWSRNHRTLSAPWTSHWERSDLNKEPFTSHWHHYDTHYKPLPADLVFVTISLRLLYNLSTQSLNGCSRSSRSNDCEIVVLTQNSVAQQYNWDASLGTQNSNQTGFRSTYWQKAFNQLFWEVIRWQDAKRCSVDKCTLQKHKLIIF